MDAFVVSARKYRPDVFADVVGQEQVTHTLQNALKTKQLAHAYLFSGPRGVGKTTCARILAKAVNCMNLSAEGDPCNTCSSCTGFASGQSMTIFELDAASNNSVDDIRRLIEGLRYLPPNGAKSVYIIDEVHMLSIAAFNAFLKTLEEPPAHALFILATTEKHKLPPTILSRCQKFDFQRIKTADIAARLGQVAQAEGIPAEATALQLVAQKADGGMRDALSIFDQIANFGGRKLTYQGVLENLHMLDYEYFFKVTETLLNQDYTRSLLLLGQVIDQGFDAYQFLTGLLDHFRNILMAQSVDTMPLLDFSEEQRARYAEQARRVDPSLLLNAYQLTAELEMRYRHTAHPRIQVELLLVKLAHLVYAIDLVQKKK